ncbi:MAG: sigma-70 region 4 domain-containing protein [Actinomycetota bacterium]|nr:sigma-70 region 4 domain-containing protein [Actinomycetota bacterium]
MGKVSPATHRGNVATVAEEQAECYRLKLAGKSVRQIAEITGLSIGTVHTRIQAGIDAVVLPLADELRKVELERYDAWQARLEDALEAGEDPVKVVPVLVRVSERRCALMGANAPEKIEATVTQVTQEDIALAELIAEAQATAAVQEAQIRGTVPAVVPGDSPRDNTIE